MKTLQNRSIYAATLLILSTILSFETKATTAVAVCNNCTTSQQYQQIAKYSSSFDTQYTYVMNYERGDLRKFRVIAIPPDFDYPGSIQVNQITATSAEQTAFSDIAMLRQEFKNFFFINKNVPEDIADSAYDLVGSSYKQNQLNDYFSQQLGIYSWQGTGLFDLDSSRLAIGAFAQIFGKITSIDIGIVIYFKNGSTMNLKVDGVSFNGRFDFVVDSAKDADGNNISFVKSDYESGEYKFSIGGNQAVNDFISAAGRLGATISNNFSIPPSGSVKVTDCPSATAGKCIVESKP